MTIIPQSKSLWNRLIGPAQRRFREDRARRVLARFPSIRGSSVIDIGGSLPFWQVVGGILQPSTVRIYNISDGRMTMHSENADGAIELRLYDGKTIPEADGSFDFVMCNSVIEHVPPEQRASFASEIRRVGRRHIVQTPSRAFPLELHFGLPFLHWLPRPIARLLVPVSPFALFSDGDPQGFFEETRLLPRREFAGYFPESEILIERSLGIPKSMIACGPAGD